MSPDDHRKATELDVQHRKLMLELRQWGSLAEPPDILNLVLAGQGRQSIVPLPVDAWHALRTAATDATRAAIAANRKQFEAL